MWTLIDFSSRMRKVSTLVREGHSCLLYGSQFYGKRRVLESVRQSCRESGAVCPHVSSRALGTGGRLDWEKIWRMTASDSTNGGVVNGADEYIDQLLAFVRSRVGGTVLLVTGASRGNEANHDQLIEALHYAVRESSGELRVVATDNYSMYSYRQGQTVRSSLAYFEEIHWGPLSDSELEECLRHVPGIPDSESRIAAYVHGAIGLTGGHIGLLNELFSHVEDAGWPRWTSEFADAMTQLLLGSSILIRIGDALSEDPEGYCTTALEYTRPRYPERSVRVDVLHQLGVLQRERASSWSMRLCSGVIETMVRNIAVEAPDAPSRVGTVLRLSEPRMFLKGDLELEEDSFVVVHISDLHVSAEHHAFFLPGYRSSQNEHARELCVLLAEDLQSLNLIGRLDAIVASGDFVWNGKDHSDFGRAREVLQKMLTQVGLTPDRLMLIPGNHDVEWDPSPGAATNSAGTSRGNYDDFVELLCKRRQQDVDIVSVVSRSGNRRLRIVGLDSNAVESKANPGIGYVASATLDRAGQLLKDDDAKHESEDVTTWLVVHHHVLPSTSAKAIDAGMRRVSVLANSDEVLYFANRWKVDLLLHGHEHQPSVSIAYRWPVDTPNELAHPATVIGAGSFGVNKTHLSPFNRNQYFVLYRRKNDLVVRSRCLGEKGIRFVSHGDLWLTR